MESAIDGRQPVLRPEQTPRSSAGGEDGAFLIDDHHTGGELIVDAIDELQLAGQRGTVLMNPPRQLEILPHALRDPARRFQMALKLAQARRVSDRVENIRDCPEDVGLHRLAIEWT